MRSINKVELLGRIGQDLELKELANNHKVVKLSVATTESYKDNSGEWKETTEWHNVVLWNKTAELAIKHLKKGSEVLINGKLKTRSWETETGEKKYATEIVSSDIRFNPVNPNNTTSNTSTLTIKNGEFEDKGDNLPF